MHLIQRNYKNKMFYYKQCIKMYGENIIIVLFKIRPPLYIYIYIYI